MAETCVIVGVGSGMGMAIARRFGRGGYDLVVMARQQQAVEAYAAQLQSEGFNAQGMTLDATDYNAVRLVFAQIQNAAVLVYNAAFVLEGEPSQLDVNELMQSFRVNVSGALMCAQQVIPAMQEQQRGTILFTGGGLALNPHPRYAGLAAGKAALRNLTYSLAAEMQPHQVYVGMVTIAGFVQEGTHFDPDTIAEAYWQLHTQRSEVEIIYR